MDTFTSLSNYMKESKDDRKLLRFSPELIVDVNPTMQKVEIEYKGDEFSFRFERQNVLVKIYREGKTLREVMPITQVSQYLRDKKMSVVVDRVFTKLPFFENIQKDFKD